MKEMNNKLREVMDYVAAYASKVKRYNLPVFVCFTVVIYLLLLFRIQGFISSQPTAEQVDSQVRAVQMPHIDQKVVRQIQTLQDNSVNVQALFNQARNNPFQQ